MRQDIQFLRGFAVSIVLLSHAGIGPASGFLGVDVFFVVSGYLITSILKQQLTDGTFSFGAFYARRAKRLLPAAYATFLLTTIGAPFFLGAVEFEAFKAQLYGALTFSANLVLLGQTDYFDASAELKPLLHIWSLSLEEQYYFILPALLLVVRARYWLHVVSLVGIASGILCAYWLLRWPEGAFYLLPTRAWELCIGSLLAIVGLGHRQPPSFLRILFWPALAMLFAIPFFPIGGPHPGLDAVLMCVATAVIIACPSNALEKSRIAWPVARIGDASYSLYLAHWPVIAFANNAYFGEGGFAHSLMLLAIGVVAGVGIYALVERPIHRTGGAFTLPKSLAGAIAGGIAVLAVQTTLGAATASSSLDFLAIRAPNFGLARECDQGREFKQRPECQSSEAPKIAVWGDSFAMHLIPGMISDDETLSMVQLTRSACPPAFGYAHFNNAVTHNEQWAHRCVDFNRSVLRYISGQDSIETVVIASNFRAFTASAPWRAVVYGVGNEYRIQPIDLSASVSALSNAVQTLRKAGKRVIIVAPPPGSQIDKSLCVERELTGKISFGARDCSISLAEDEKSYGDELALLDMVEQTADVAVLNPRDVLCDDQSCKTIADGMPLYRDPTHLSISGSSWFGEAFDIVSRIERMAR